MLAAGQLYFLTSGSDTVSVEPPFLNEGALTGKSMRDSFNSRLRAVASFLLVALLAACGGGGGGGGSALPPSGTPNQRNSVVSSSGYDTLVLSDKPVEYYRLDESSGTIAADSSGNGANGTYLGTPGVDYRAGQTPGPIVQEGQGWLQSLRTTTSHGIAAPAVTGATSTSSWTLEAWVKLSALPAPGQWITIAGSSGANRFLVASNGTLLYQNVTGKSLTSATVLQVGIAYHVVLKSDLSAGTFGTVSITINGNKDANTLPYAGTSNRQGMLSSYYWGQYDTSGNYKWNGYLGRVAYYTTALPDAEITNHYSQGLALGTPTPAPSASPTPVVSPTPVPTPAPSASSQTAITTPTGVSSFAAPIYKYSTTVISVNPRPNCGHQNIPVGPSTTYFNPPVGLVWAVFTGLNAPCSTAFTGSTVSLYPAQPTTTTVSGTVVQATAYGFTLNAGASGSAVPVILTSSTAIFGGQLVTGANVTVTGVGSANVSIVAGQIAVAAATPNPSASPSATPGPISLQHVMTAGFVYGYAGTPTTVPLSSITPWQTWAFTDVPHAALFRAAGIKVTIYSIFWRNHQTDNPIIGYTDLAPGGGHAAAEAADCNGNAIWDPIYGGGYASDARVSAAVGHAQVVANYKLGQYGSNYDALFSDEAGTFYGMPLPCNYNEQSYDQAVNSVHSALAVPMFVNALGSKSAYALTLADAPNILGAMCELCYGLNINGVDTVDTSSHGSWQWVENAEISMAAKHKIFWDYARLSGDPTAEIGLRSYVYASLMLTYDPNYVMFEEAFPTASGYPVMPENGLVVQQPLTTASSVDGYLAPGGAYFREYRACYYRGAFVNNCAVAINPSTTATVPVPSTSYFHSMALSGSGVLDGGTIGFTGPQVTQLAPASAVILFP